MPTIEELEQQIRDVRILAEDALDKFPLRSTTTPGAVRERHIHDLGKHPGGVIAARVHNSAAITITTATETALTFDSERYDTDNIHSTSSNTSRLTAKTAGKYTITGQARWNAAAGGDRELRIRLNGSTRIAEAEPASAADAAAVPAQTVTTQYELAVDDYVELTVRHTQGSNLNIRAESNFTPEFMMSRVGAAGTAGGGTPGTDHGALTGLTDDDHSQYLLHAGTRALTGNWDVGAFNIKHEDNKGVIFGTGDDASIIYDGTDLIIDPDLVGSGGVKITGADPQLTITTTDTSNASLRLRPTGGSTPRDWQFFSSTSDGSFGIRDDTASARRVTIDSSGNMALGTGNPQSGALLDLQGGTGAIRSVVSTTTARATANVGTQYDDGSGAAWTVGAHQGNFFVIGAAFEIYMQPDGDIGFNIGSATAGAQMHVDQNATDGDQPVLLLDQADTGESVIVMTSDDNDVDIDLIRVTVTGTPTFKWDESEDGLNLSHGLVINEGGSDSDTRIEGDIATSLFKIDAGLDAVQMTPTTTRASASGATWDGINVKATTATVTGTTQITTATGFNLVNIGRPTITDASAVTIALAATLYISNSPLAAGSVTLTTPLALWVDAGTTRLDGDLQFGSSAGVIKDASGDTRISIADATGITFSSTSSEDFVFSGGRIVIDSGEEIGTDTGGRIIFKTTDKKVTFVASTVAWTSTTTHSIGGTDIINWVSSLVNCLIDFTVDGATVLSSTLAVTGAVTGSGIATFDKREVNRYAYSV